MHDSEQKDASGFFLKMIFNYILVQRKLSICYIDAE